jgi:multidrug efflux pump subunit AcrB
VKDEIQQLPNISQVETFGARDYEIAIEVSEERLRQYGLSFCRCVQRHSPQQPQSGWRHHSYPEEEIRVRTMGRKYTGKELSSIVVLARPEGDVITLDQLAHINDGFGRPHRCHNQRRTGRPFDRLQNA